MTTGKKELCEGRYLPGVPGEEIERIYNDAPGREITSGNFDSPESSAALAANAFGFFLFRYSDLPLLPKCEPSTWPVRSLHLEQTIRFPWTGGRHPVLDVVVTTESVFIGIESKRFEPFRDNKKPVFSGAYSRPVWGERMKGYEKIRDQENARYNHLDVAQLVKHAFALRTEVNKTEVNNSNHGLKPILLYLYAEPKFWPENKNPVDKKAIADHRKEIDDFANDVEGDEVQFMACTYQTMLAGWSKHDDPRIRAHARAVIARFAP